MTCRIHLDAEVLTESDDFQGTEIPETSSVTGPQPSSQSQDSEVLTSYFKPGVDWEERPSCLDNPFKILKIEGDKAEFEYFAPLVPLSELQLH